MGKGLKIFFIEFDPFQVFFQKTDANTVGILVEETLQRVSSDGMKDTHGDRFVLLYVSKKINAGILPAEEIIVLLDNGNDLMIDHPFKKLVDILKMIIKGLTVQPAALDDFPDADLVERLDGHTFFQRFS
jgi:hypothetical protein